MLRRAKCILCKSIVADNTPDNYPKRHKLYECSGCGRKWDYDEETHQAKRI